ncbi:hypothetical protein IMSHALPRED_008974 [Imshaugia aleurites]|uniref:Uncharacterized protein n=1 Tax=Imshaugia aleurites TaxID=172621 RepID=A0A8H3IUG6_9LECA|nr:hypothetical protein IMSHALPRED_008974 [Imshaugia aleurites]
MASIIVSISVIADVYMVTTTQIPSNNVESTHTPHSKTTTKTPAPKSHSTSRRKTTSRKPASIGTSTTITTPLPSYSITYLANPDPQPQTYSAYLTNTPSLVLPTTSPTTIPLLHTPTSHPHWPPHLLAALIIATLLSALALLLILAIVHRLHASRRRKIAQLEHGPGIDEPPLRRGRSRNASRSRHNRTRALSSSYAQQHRSTSNSNQHNHQHNHHHNNHNHNHNAPSRHWLFSPFIFPLRHLRPFFTLFPIKKTNPDPNQTKPPPQPQSQPQPEKPRRIAGLEAIEPGPAVLRSLYESALDGSRAAVVGVGGRESGRGKGGFEREWGWGWGWG